MSNAPSTLDGEQLVTDRSPGLPVSAEAALRTLRDSVQAVGFWSAVALPLAYVPALTGGVAGGESAFAALLAAHAAALLCGHGHRAD